MKEQIIEQQEKEKKYELPKDNIIACDENSEIRKENKDYFKGLAEEGIIWPVEIQGTGQSDFKKKKFKVWYPAGDVFLSFAVTIHELGHLRQGEIDERFAIKELGAPEPKLKEDEINHYESEKDAWQRGWERARKYCPKDLEAMENKFQEYKKRRKFNDFEHFADFYKYVVEVGLKITEFNDKVEKPNKENKKLKGKLIGRMIKENKLTRKFFIKQEEWRTGEKIDKDFAESFIKRAAAEIAEEEY